MKFYTVPPSDNCRRVAITAHACGTDCEIKIVNLPEGENRTAEYLAINPNSKVPSLVDGDVQLWESSAISQYIAAKANRRDLWPSEPAAQANVSRWQFWNHTTLTKPCGTLNFERILKGMFNMGPADESVCEGAVKDFRGAASVLDAQLDGRKFLCGDEMTLADISVASTLTNADMVKLPIGEYPNLKAWRDRCEATESFKANIPPHLQ